MTGNSDNWSTTIGKECNPAKARRIARLPRFFMAGDKPRKPESRPPSGPWCFTGCDTARMDVLPGAADERTFHQRAIKEVRFYGERVAANPARDAQSECAITLARRS